MSNPAQIQLKLHHEQNSILSILIEQSYVRMKMEISNTIHDLHSSVNLFLDLISMSKMESFKRCRRFLTTKDTMTMENKHKKPCNCGQRQQ